MNMRIQIFIPVAVVLYLLYPYYQDTDSKQGQFDNELCDDARLTPHPWICSTLHRCHMALVRLVLQ